MPIVKREKVYCNGIPWTRVIKCSSAGRFSIDLPPHLQDVMDKRTIEGTTLKDVLSAWTKMVSEYDDSKSKTRRVILYSIKVNGYIMGPASMMKSGDDREGHFDPTDDICLLNEQDISFTEGTAVAVSAAVYNEVTTTTPDGEVRVVMEREEDRDIQLPSGLSHGWDKREYGNRYTGPIIEWTPDRHSFFINVHTALNTIIWSLADFKDEKKLLMFADTGKQLIGGVSDGNKQLE